MTAKTLTALRGSIKKWDRIVRSTKAKDRGLLNCPLCKIFVDSDGHTDCIGCPVATKTGFVECEGSPYIKFIDHLNSIVDHPGISREPGCKECMYYACAERDFLASLLPKGIKGEKK